MSDSFNGNDRPRPTYGQSVNEAPNQYNSYGQPSASEAQGSGPYQSAPEYSPSGQQYQPQSQYSSSGQQFQPQNQYAQPQYAPQAQQGAFGGYGTPYGYGGAAVKPKQKPIGIILTLIGVFLLIVSAVLFGVAVWRTGSGFVSEMGDLRSSTRPIASSPVARPPTTSRSTALR